MRAVKENGELVFVFQEGGPLATHPTVLYEEALLVSSVQQRGVDAEHQAILRDLSRLGCPCVSLEAAVQFANCFYLGSFGRGLVSLRTACGILEFQVSWMGGIYIRLMNRRQFREALQRYRCIPRTVH